MRIPGTTHSGTIRVKNYAEDRARAGFELIADLTLEPLYRPLLSDSGGTSAGIGSLLKLINRRVGRVPRLAWLGAESEK